MFPKFPSLEENGSLLLLFFFFPSETVGENMAMRWFKEILISWINFNKLIQALLQQGSTVRKWELFQQEWETHNQICSNWHKEDEKWQNFQVFLNLNIWSLIFLKCHRLAAKGLQNHILKFCTAWNKKTQLTAKIGLC